MLECAHLTIRKLSIDKLQSVTSNLSDLQLKGARAGVGDRSSKEENPDMSGMLPMRANSARETPRYFRSKRRLRKLPAILNIKRDKRKCNQ